MFQIHDTLFGFNIDGDPIAIALFIEVQRHLAHKRQRHSITIQPQIAAEYASRCQWRSVRIQSWRCGDVRDRIFEFRSGAR